MTLPRLITALALLAAFCVALPAAAQSTSTTFQVRISISSVCAFTAPGATDVDFGPDGAMYLADFYNQAVIHNDNVFEVLMDAVRVCSLGQITSALFEVGGQYRRNM